MCGIFGWSIVKKAGIYAAQREALASVLAIANSLRGDHSWGAYMVTQHGRVKIEKHVGDIANVTGIARFGAMPLVMAHTRYATVGAITKRNAHPFRVGPITLAHNGAVWNNEELIKKYDRKSVEVDSEHLAYHMAEEKPFDEIEGYGAIEWIDKREDDLVYLCRMKGGSLSVYAIENHRKEQVGCVWSSDADHLKSAVGAARLSGYMYDRLDEGVIHFVEDGKLFFRKEGKIELSAKERTYSYVGRSYYGYSGYGSEGEWKWDEDEAEIWDEDRKRWVKSDAVRSADSEKKIDTSKALCTMMIGRETFYQLDQDLWVDGDNRLYDNDEVEELIEMYEEMERPVDEEMERKIG